MNVGKQIQCCRKNLQYGFLPSCLCIVNTPPFFFLIYSLALRLPVYLHTDARSSHTRIGFEDRTNVNQQFNDFFYLKSSEVLKLLIRITVGYGCDGSLLLQSGSILNMYVLTRSFEANCRHNFLRYDETLGNREERNVKRGQNQTIFSGTQ